MQWGLRLEESLGPEVGFVTRRSGATLASRVTLDTGSELKGKESNHPWDGCGALEVVYTPRGPCGPRGLGGRQ